MAERIKFGPLRSACGRTLERHILLSLTSWGRYRLVALTPSPDLFICANVLFVEPNRPMLSLAASRSGLPSASWPWEPGCKPELGALLSARTQPLPDLAACHRMRRPVLRQELRQRVDKTSAV